MRKIIQTSAVILASVFMAHTPAASLPLEVAVVPVRIPESIELDGLIEPSADLNIGAEVDGVVAEILVERGDHLNAGDVIARLESELEEAQMEIAVARAESTAQVESATTAVDLSRQRAKRQRQLFEEKVVSWIVLEESETELRLAELQLIVAKENQRMAQLEVKRTRALLERRTIRSPISGVVVARFLGAGEIVYRANRDQIVRIAQIDPLLIEIIAPLAVHGRLAVGDKVTVLPDSPVGGSYQAVVTVVDSVIDAASGTLGVRCELPNPEGSLPAGLRCRVVATLR